MTVYETSPRNSGRASYTFAARDRFIKSNDFMRFVRVVFIFEFISSPSLHAHSTGAEPEYYGTRDMRVGNTLVINGHHFELTEAAKGPCLKFVFGIVEALLLM